MIKDAALRYADNGWPVFPLYGVTNGQCDCGLKCSSPGKHPIPKNGLNDASVDFAQIEAWWEKYPNANVAIATGRVSGLLVLDVDNKRSVEIGNTLVGQGDLSIRELEQEHGPIPEGRYADTGGGGRHYFFQFPETGDYGNRANIRPGLDVRADGGYVVAPPSMHLSGHSYTWGNQDIQPRRAPAWLEGLVQGQNVSPDDIGDDDAVIEGSRNTYLHALGAKYRHEVGLTDWQLFGLLMAHNMRQCQPPLTADEVRVIARSCAKYEYTPPVDLSHWDDGTPEIPEGGDLAVSLEQLILNPPTPPDPLVRGVMDCGTGVLFGGQPNVGKSWMVMDLALAISAGATWLDHFQTEVGPVLMIDEEGTEYGQYERFQMLLDGHRDGLSAIGLPLHVAIGTGVRLDTDVGITRVRRMLERYKPRIVILDSLVRLHSGDENSAKSMSKFFDITKSLMRTYGTTFCFTHHVRKPSLESNDPGDLLRGTSEIRAWPDTIFVATPGDTNQDVVIHHVKARYGKRMNPFRVIMQIDDEEAKARIVFDGEIGEDERGIATNQNRILKAIADLQEQDEFPTTDLIAERVQRTARTVREYMPRLVQSRAVEKFDVPNGTGRPLIAYRIAGA